MTASVQLRLDGLPLDPHQLAELSIFERIDLYVALGLSIEQREAAEQAVRLIVAGEYRKGRS